MKRFLGLLVATVLAVGGGVALAGPASADVSIDTLVPVVPGGVLAVSGTGCPALAPVEVLVWSTRSGASVVVPGTTTAAGAYHLDVTVESPHESAFIGGEQVGVGVFCTGGTPLIDVADKIAYVYLLLPEPPTVGLTLSAPRQTYGTPLTVKVSVVPGAHGVLEVRLDGEPLAPVESYWVGAATYALPATLAVGTHRLEAEFDPETAGPNVTVSRTVTVVKRPTTTTLTTSATRWRYGATRPTATATVSSPGPGAVRFTIGGKRIGAPVAVVGGKAKVRLPVRSAGTHAVSATFVPTTPATVAGSTSAVRRVKVTKALAVATVKLSPKVKRSAKATVRITVKARGVGAPTGKVAIYDGKKKIKTVTLKKAHRGKRAVKIPRIKKLGTHKISVRYLGSANVKADRSPAKKLRVVR